MSVRAGREFLAIPGPTTVPDEVLRAMHRPAVDIYSGPLLALTDGLLRDIAQVFNTKGRAYIYISNGHGAWEAALTNVLSKGDKILVLESGRFAIGWGENARRMGVEVEILKGDMRRAVRPAEVEARLKADKGKTIKAILVAQIDTASGVVNDIPAIGQAVKRRRPRRAADGRRRGVARLHAVQHGRVGRRRRHVGLAEGHDGAAGPGLRRRQRPRARGAQEGGPAHALLGLDRPRGRPALPEIRRHAARASAVRPARGDGHAVCRGSRQRVPPPPAAGRGGAPRRRHLGRGPGDRLQHRRAQRALRHGHRRADEQRPQSRGAARLLQREVRRHPRPRHRRPVGQGVPRRPHGPRQCADDPRHPERDRSGPQRPGNPARQGRRAGRDRLAGPAGQGCSGAALQAPVACRATASPFRRRRRRAAPWARRTGGRRSAARTAGRACRSRCTPTGRDCRRR